MQSYIDAPLGFPVELLQYVVELLVAPAHPLSYIYMPGVRDILLNLCLSSRTFCTIARPHLYSSVRLASQIELALLERTFASSPHLARHVNSLSLPDFSSDSPHSLLPPSSMYLLSVLSSVRPFVRRILFDRPLRAFHPEYDEHGIRRQLREVMEHLHHLEEFTSVQCELFLSGLDETDYNPGIDQWFVCWPTWTFLRRLSLHNPMVNDEFVEGVAGLDNLTHLAFDNPDFDDYPILGALLRSSGQNLQRMIFVSGQEPELAFFGRGGLQNVREVARTARAGLEVVLLRARVEDDQNMYDVMNWVGNRVEDGTLWELEGLYLSDTG